MRREPRLMPLGPKRVPGRPVVAVSNGAPRNAMSYFETELSSSLEERQCVQGRLAKVLRPAYLVSKWKEGKSPASCSARNGDWDCWVGCWSGAIGGNVMSRAKMRCVVVMRRTEIMVIVLAL